ncbi:MAG: 1-aminocyclopropane-1-carboxylate deaminase/D-cysteine desulfhydrase [Streptomycetales bacterium]
MDVRPGEDPYVELHLPSPVYELADDRLVRRRVRLLVKRDDLIHSELPGNKWRKLKYNLAAAAEQGHDTLLTFGGAFSNHIRATAAAGHYFGFDTVGVIRGEEHLPLNPVLAYAVSRGMRLTYLDRGTYRRKHTSEVIERLQRAWGRSYLLPEGGSNELAVRGCAELTGEIDVDFDVICCPVGTGGTLAGVAANLKPGQQAVGISVLKGGEFLSREVEQLQRRTFGNSSANWQIEYGFHFGGYAKKTKELEQFAADFAFRHGVMLEGVHVAKTMFGVFALAQQDRFEPGTRIVVVITG